MLTKPDTDSMDPWQKKRQRRVKYVEDLIKEAGRIEKKRLLGYLGKCGIHRDTARSYLKDLMDYGSIKEEGNEIIWIDDNKA